MLSRNGKGNGKGKSTTGKVESHSSSSGSDSRDAAASVLISDTEAWEKNKKFTVYKVVVCSGGKTWFIFRRYNEFHHLYEKLKRKYPHANLKLPGKKLFGNMDPAFIKHRREGLHEFTQKLLSSQELMALPEVRQFLNIDNVRNSGDDDENLDDNSMDAASNEINLGPSEKKSARPSDFQFLKVIGKGSFGKVLLARHKAEETLYAIKVLQKKAIMKRNEVRHIMSERNVLVMSVKHPFLVGLHFSFQSADKLYFVLDYVNGGELFFHLQRERYFPEARAKFYAAEMASAIGYLHSMNIIYRDLKPENILLDSQGHVKLTDFGLCKEGIEHRTTTSTFCGTPEYLAPEVLRKQPYDTTVDWWCLGAVLYEMMYGLPPFYSRDTAEMYDNILYKPLKLRTNVTIQARNILEGLLQKERENRLGAANDFKDIKTHPFFFSINWDDLDAKRIMPPYNPNIKDPLDLKHFDPEFVREPVPQSVGKSVDSGHMISASVLEADNAFLGFSYAPPIQDVFEDDDY
ncbi:serine/threonine-protein kinase Sgk1-like [Tubulanus polymorphus]|uniref:serine/threonine-protein kinase Sgk1-like n=1 Tax=Tubulanus polymorphus TaxID=672921 RepID=UPI003DA50912